MIEILKKIREAEKKMTQNSKKNIGNSNLLVSIEEFINTLSHFCLNLEKLIRLFSVIIITLLNINVDAMYIRIMT